MNVGLLRGEKYTLNDQSSSEVLCISAKGATALLQKEDGYIVLSGTQMTENLKINWNYLSQYRELSLAARCFEALTNDYISDMNTLKDLLKREPYNKYLGVVLSIEKNYDFEIDEKEKEKIDRIYDIFMDHDDLPLISEDVDKLYNGTSELLEEAEEEEER